MVFSGCSPSDYYASIASPTGSNLHELVKSTHRNTLPYTSSSTDVWDALIDLDGDGSGSNVNLIYRAIQMPNSLQGETDGWNREHLWPKSYGVGYSGSDFTDLHHLRPADWGVNAARGNKQFSSCWDSNDCTVPANAEAASDTSSDIYRWMPPAAVRGDIARAMFYMDVRYNGDDDPDLKDLVLSDCPSKDDAKLGYLSELLRWHEADPVDSAEVARNSKVCEDYQGNRNPFVDHPEYVASIFGSAKDQSEYNCDKSATKSPTPAPIDPIPSPVPHSEGACNGLEPGDIVPIAVNTNNPDSVIFLPLVDLPQFSSIYITDNAWTGYHFYQNEGTRVFTVPEGGILRGETFGFAVGQWTNRWATESGSFSLSTQGDSVLVYCFGADANGQVSKNANLEFLGGLSTASDGWAAREVFDDSSDYDYGSTHSAVPVSLENFAAPALPKKKNYGFLLNPGLCKNPPRCTREEILSQYMELGNWEGSDFDGYDTSLVDSLVQMADKGNPRSEEDPDEMMNFILIGLAVLFGLVLGCVFCLLCRKKEPKPASRFDMTKNKQKENLQSVNRRKSKGIEHEKLKVAVGKGLKAGTRGHNKNKNIELV
ncbi:hypothetical protein TrVE_jg1459 [Triparma verrucosa]|uniref:Uncharacterized protein n=1 Tax=Triparma verrucosa TaxID=1606542 RepID=A0A9W7BDC7_9STRA|nr:hypothetical protein TrVE_jg1459 [Triparma verrucosa]